MNKQLSYKYINLLFRLLIGASAIIYITLKIKDTYSDYITRFSLNDINYFMLALAIALVVLNWGLEANKWKFAIREVEKISLFRSFRLILTSITISLLTPNRVGEIPSRVFLLGNRKDLKKLITLTSYGAYAQALSTLLFGFIGFYITRDYFIHIPFIYLILAGFMTLSISLLFLFFKPVILKSIIDRVPFIRKRELLSSIIDLRTEFLFKLLSISILRYSIFFIQYYLVLSAFNIGLDHNFDFFLIAICFMIGSFIPTILLSEIGVRGSVAIFIYGMVSDLDVAIFLASITLWFINVALPACVGSLYLNQFKLYQSR